MDVSRKNCKRDYSSEDTRCFTCQTKSNLLYLTTYPHSREGSLREKSPCLENGKKSEKQKEPSGCTKCKYYVEFISNLMDGIICDELQESKRQDGVHDCSTRPELDSQQKIKIVQKLYILFSDAQVAALGGRLKRRKPSYCSDDQSSGIISREESCFERDPCKNDDASPGYLEVIPELESQCGSINAKKTGQKTRQFTSKENKVVMKRKSYSPGLLPKLSSPMMDQRRRSSACTSYASRKSKDTSLSGCSCRSRNDSVASSDNRKIRLLSFKNRRSVENDRIQKSRYDPSNKHSSEKGFQNGRYKCPVVLQKSNSPNCGPKNKSTKNTERKARNVRSEPLQKASPYSSTAGKKCCHNLADREIQKCQSASKLKAESYDELVSEESNLNLMGLPKSFLYHTNSHGKCTSLIIAGSKDQPSVSDGSHNIRIDFETLKKKCGRKYNI
ncbi:Hypothetical protein NTJ_11021 [Nesidiocoris tenuis]|nr:Hypothetical protein NTJ_11021 [Nesidiocoris tenuis]